MTTAKHDTMVQPYLFFDGRCEEALDFYSKTLGAKVEAVAHFKDSPDPTMCMPGIDQNKVMHACFRIGANTIMASDGRCTGRPSFQGFSLSLTLAEEAEADRLFAALAKGGQVQMPLATTFFSPRFGDRKSTRLNSSHVRISYAVFCLKKKKNTNHTETFTKKNKKQSKKKQ